MYALFLFSFCRFAILSSLPIQNDTATAADRQVLRLEVHERDVRCGDAVRRDDVVVELSGSRVRRSVPDAVDERSDADVFLAVAGGVDLGGDRDRVRRALPCVTAERSDRRAWDVCVSVSAGGDAAAACGVHGDRADATQGLHSSDDTLAF